MYFLAQRAPGSLQRLGCAKSIDDLPNDCLTDFLCLLACFASFFLAYLLSQVFKAGFKQGTFLLLFFSPGSLVPLHHNGEQIRPATGKALVFGSFLTHKDLKEKNKTVGPTTKYIPETKKDLYKKKVFLKV